MAKIVGGIMSSHVPAIGRAIARNLQGDPYWKPWFDGFPPVRDWLAEVKPDVAVVVYNDHGLNFFLDKMPTFALGCADTYYNDDEGWALKPVSPFIVMAMGFPPGSLQPDISQVKHAPAKRKAAHDDEDAYSHMQHRQTRTGPLAAAGGNG